MDAGKRQLGGFYMGFWRKIFGEGEPAAPRKGPMLSPETQRRVNLIFRLEEQNIVATLLITECGNNLPDLENLDEYRLERFRFAALKVSNGNLDKLREAIELAKYDWRDLLLAAGFANDATEHNRWLPKPLASG
jgi:hypothetical protein